MNDFPKFILQLKQQLSKPLIGYEAQKIMEFVLRKRFLEELQHDEPPKESAVMILLFPAKNDFEIVFIQRVNYNGVHSGQISFPGGQAEKSDGSLLATSLRETEEEIGISRNQIEVLGQLSPLYIPPSNFNVHPFVGFVDYKPDFHKDINEVKEIFSVPLKVLFSSESKQMKQIKIHTGENVIVPCFFVQEKIIWGATGMILSEFVETCKLFFKSHFFQN